MFIIIMPFVYMVAIATTIGYGADIWKTKMRGTNKNHFNMYLLLFA